MDIIMGTREKKPAGKKKLVDFHCHILPEMDDGAKSPIESVQMLEILYRQNVTGCILTPHFYLEENSVEQFLKRREKSYAKLNSYIGNRQDLPEMVEGAEVYFCHRLYQVSQIEKLKIGASNYILIELPYYTKIKRAIIDEIKLFQDYTGLSVILAHIERYLNNMTISALYCLRDSDIVLQMNTGSVLNEACGRKMSRIYQSDSLIVVGSDCHNLHERSPERFQEAVNCLQKRRAHGKKSSYEYEISKMYEEMRRNE